MKEKKVVLVVNDTRLLEVTTGIFAGQSFTVFPFYHFEEIPVELFSPEQLFVWEVKDISAENLKWIDFLKKKESIRFIVMDLLSDQYVTHLIDDPKTYLELSKQSYKIRDLLHMAEMVFAEEYPFAALKSYLVEDSLLFSEEITQGENYLEEAERIIGDFLQKYDLEKKIRDKDIFFLALGEIIENFVEYQLIKLKKVPKITLEYGFDKERIVISARDKLGEADLGPLLKSFVRPLSMKGDESGGEYSKEGVYVGPRGRGMNIVKHGAHRLISIIKRESEAILDKRTQFIFIVYLDKKEEATDNASVNMIVCF
ncbi:MAG: hypothetical protein CVV50_00710 [Spirochaetae bacterium HGW-Spirochaetae-6]|nr:MAG: hypothetical protein CVV50_00710 [Spirochaetae bacterium HGW-Spirochaetae-6]